MVCLLLHAAYLHRRISGEVSIGSYADLVIVGSSGLEQGGSLGLSSARF